ncbi:MULTISPECIES: hypothetical protein [Streptomyces]|nr:MULTISPECIES: hypothetical protein [Streptomyces]MDN5384588.1 hypothetical protein [Streptomyces sp. LB8]
MRCGPCSRWCSSAPVLVLRKLLAQAAARDAEAVRMRAEPAG